LKIKIMKNLLGSPDHIRTVEFHADQIVEVGSDDMPLELANSLLGDGSAREVSELEAAVSDMSDSDEPTPTSRRGRAPGPSATK
jgi:hypothetical protein